MLSRRIAVLALVITLLMLAVSVAEACPTCKLALGSHDKAQGDLVFAYMVSILFMMAMPFTLLAAFGTYLYYQVRRAQRQRDAAASAVAAHAEAREEETIGV